MGAEKLEVTTSGIRTKGSPTTCQMCDNCSSLNSSTITGSFGVSTGGSCKWQGSICDEDSHEFKCSMDTMLVSLSRINGQWRLTCTMTDVIGVFQIAWRSAPLGSSQPDPKTFSNVVCFPIKDTSKCDGSASTAIISHFTGEADPSLPTFRCDEKPTPTCFTSGFSGTSCRDRGPSAMEVKLPGFTAQAQPNCILQELCPEWTGEYLLEQFTFNGCEFGPVSIDSDACGFAELTGLLIPNRTNFQIEVLLFAGCGNDWKNVWLWRVDLGDRYTCPPHRLFQVVQCSLNGDTVALPLVESSSFRFGVDEPVKCCDTNGNVLVTMVP